VTEGSRVLRVHRIWFLTSDRLQPWLIPSGTTRSRQQHKSTIVWRNLPLYDRFWYFVLSFSSKRAWQSESKHYQRWNESRLHPTMVDSWCGLDRIVPEGMSQVSRRSEVGNHKQRTVLRWALLPNGYFVHFSHYVYSKTFSFLRISKNPSNDSSWRCPLYRSTIFKSWLQLLSVSIFELPNKSPSFRLRHSANEKLLNVYVPHPSMKSDRDSRNLYNK